MRQNLLIGITVIVLISNVFLGYELYTLTHPQQASATTPVYINGTTIENQTKIISVTNGTAFSYEYKFSLSFPKVGVYLLGMNPSGFSSLYVLIYQDDGTSITLSLNNTKAQLIVDDQSIPVTMFVSGVFNQTPSPQTVLKSLGLYYQYVDPINLVSNGSVSTDHPDNSTSITNSSSTDNSPDQGTVNGTTTHEDNVTQSNQGTVNSTSTHEDNETQTNSTNTTQTNNHESNSTNDNHDSNNNSNSTNSSSSGSSSSSSSGSSDSGSSSSSSSGSSDSGSSSGGDN